jgi:enterochelin esterase-like enzyme
MNTRHFSLIATASCLHPPSEASGRVGNRAFSEIAGEGEDGGDQREVLKTLLIAFIAFSFPSTLIAQEQATETARPSAWDAKHWYYIHPEEPRQPLLKGVTHHRIRSEKMDRDVGVNILVPPDYETNVTQRHSVIYNLHGATGHEGCRGFAPLIYRLMQEKKVADAIWVFPNGGQGSMWRDGPEGNPHRTYVDTFVIQELIPYIDQNWRTIPQREGRAVTGFSMGGYGSVRFAFDRPDLFSACLSISGGAFEPKDEKERQAKPLNYFPSLLIEKNFEQLNKRLALKLIAGTEDFNMKPVRKFAEILAEHHFEFEQEYPEGLSHKDLGKYFTEDVVSWLHSKVKSSGP